MTSADAGAVAAAGSRRQHPPSACGAARPPVAAAPSPAATPLHRPDAASRHARSRPGWCRSRSTRMHADVASYLQPSPTRPLYAGAVVLAAHDGTVVVARAFGHNLRYADGTAPSSRATSGWPPARTPSSTWPRCRSCSPRSSWCSRSRRAASTSTQPWPPTSPPSRRTARGTHRAPTAHPHVGPARMAAALQRLPHRRGALAGRTRRQPTAAPGASVPVLRPQPDHARRRSSSS